MKRAWRTFFTDKHGKLVIWQWPNVPLIAWLIFWLLAKLITKGGWHAALSAVSSAAILVWVLLEIVWGASYFRRLLGLVVFIVTVSSKL